MAVNWLATSNVLETSHRALADAARRVPDCDHGMIHEAIVNLSTLSKIARQRAGQDKATEQSRAHVLDMQSRGVSLKTNVGDPNPKGPSGGGGKNTKKH